LANLKDLIVRGAARIAGKLNVNDIEIGGSVTGNAVDLSVKSGSNNLITSGGVYDALTTLHIQPDHYSTVDPTSTSTQFTATVATLSADNTHVDGTRVWIFNNVVASQTGCTLDINNQGGKPIYLSNAMTTRVSTHWTVNTMYEFMYSSSVVSGGAWIMCTGRDTNTTYTNASLGQGYGICSTASSVSEKAVVLSSYALTTGGMVAVKFENAVSANATMNINSRGAKSIYFKGSAISSGVIDAGDLATFVYDGTRYHLISIDSGSGDDYTLLSGGSASSF